MAEIIIPGPAGRIEAKYHAQLENSAAPTALILHPHPLHGGTMNNKMTYTLYQSFYRAGFHVCRFNFRGIGKSSGSYDGGEGELSDAASVMDWLQSKNQESSQFWIAGFSFGAWIALQLLMRRPEIAGFVVASPPTNKYDFNFLAPCPVSGLILQGDQDDVVPESGVASLASKLKAQKDIEVVYKVIQGTDHFFINSLPSVSAAVQTYLKSHKPFTG
jgi:alpha/beta superfamily hydrolase